METVEIGQHCPFLPAAGPRGRSRADFDRLGGGAAGDKARRRRLSRRQHRLNIDSERFGVRRLPTAGNLLGWELPLKGGAR
ncbi:MAG: hypothetical protein AVDCRST_MAG88-2274 [uncultured Thermomicrobiales bacterium]|uniref:Uncharacterized protein n=1 Tax=uncultured Thermomicrobiales bacterium TaxID=1645740 RepID=A0A6J4V6W7_9BACT|nr:MAG: hypothetical protein AVDCRST_MAG88-2274 [uncultured Thermomicrobiales bacterium]